MSFFNPSFIPTHIWKWVKWPVWTVLACVVAFFLYVIYLLPISIAKYKDETRVPEIMAAHISLDDVLGTNLPPTPDQQKVNATLEGVDANNNGIRDDVELALFELHPDDIVLRAAQLQYAFAMQMYFTKVKSEGTLRAVGSQNSRASFCLWDTVPVPWNDRSEITQELSTQVNIIQDRITKEVDDAILNTEHRIQYTDNLYRKYPSGGGSGWEPHCDISKDLLNEQS